MMSLRSFWLFYFYSVERTALTEGGEISLKKITGLVRKSLSEKLS